MRGYEKVLHLALRFKPVVLIGVVVLLVISAVLSVSRGTAFMPEMESTQITVSVTMPNGTPLVKTAEITDKVVEKVATVEDVEDIGAMAGGNSYASLMGANDVVANQVSIYVTLKEDKVHTAKEIGKMIEESA